MGWTSETLEAEDYPNMLLKLTNMVGKGKLARNSSHVSSLLFLWRKPAQWLSQDSHPVFQNVRQLWNTFPVEKLKITSQGPWRPPRPKTLGPLFAMQIRRHFDFQRSVGCISNSKRFQCLLETGQRVLNLHANLTLWVSTEPAFIQLVKKKLLWLGDKEHWHFAISNSQYKSLWRWSARAKRGWGILICMRARALHSQLWMNGPPHNLAVNRN